MWCGRPRWRIQRASRSRKSPPARMINSAESMANESALHSKRVFLSAEWRDLVMLNYRVAPALLARDLPPGTSMDSFQGETYVSLVGFRFCRTKLLGYFPVPFHTDFDEVNLRFYVRRLEGGENRRGVVFIAEVVPRRAISMTARLIYGENYKHAPMTHSIQTQGPNTEIEFQWQVFGKWCRVSAQTAGVPAYPQPGTLEQFITEHYWGYSAPRSGGCLEYQLSHVPWKVWSTSRALFEGDASALYGHELAAVLRQSPNSAFVADGSPVKVFKGVRIL